MNTVRCKERYALAAVLPALLVVAACGSAPAAEAVTARDSAGVAIIENHSPEWAEARIQVSAEPVVTIGSASGDETQELYRVAGALRLRDGRLLVLNSGASELRIYSAAGEHERTFGRAGSGPGEFRSPRWAVERGDTIIVYDPFQDNGRISYFTSAGDFLSDGKLVVAGLNYPSPNGMLPDGSFISELSEGSIGWTDVGYVSYTRSIITFPRDGSRIDTLAVTGGAEMFREEFRGGIAQWDVPFGRRPMTAQHGDRIYLGDGADFKIDVFDVGGTHRASIRSAFEARPVGDAEVRQWIDGTLDVPFYHAQPEAAARNRERYEKTPAASTMPAFDALVVDAAGRVWARRFVPPWETGNVWRVFDAEGRWLSDVAVPDGLDVLEIGHDYVLGTHTDELGVEYVQMHAIRIDRQGR
jgi:hypothetical protein